MKKMITLLAVLALTLALLAGCGQDGAPQAPDPAPAPAAGGTDTQKAPPVSDPGPGPEETQTPEDAAPAEDAPAGEDAPQPSDGVQTVDVQPGEPAPDPAEPEELPASAPAEPEPEPETEPAPEPEGESVRAGDAYTISVALEGGSGRATVESPAALRYDETGKCWATIVWSSPYFDYMKVDGQRYDPINTEGNSTFEIPVSALDEPLAVIADTVAMSEPHEVEYTLTFDSASMENA